MSRDRQWTGLSDTELEDWITQAYRVKRAIPDLIVEARRRAWSYPKLGKLAGVSHSSIIGTYTRARRKEEESLAPS